MNDGKRSRNINKQKNTIDDIGASNFVPRILNQQRWFCILCSVDFHLHHSPQN